MKCHVDVYILPSYLQIICGYVDYKVNTHITTVKKVEIISDKFNSECFLQSNVL
jgi:hypothetical protein